MKMYLLYVLSRDSSHEIQKTQDFVFQSILYFQIILRALSLTEIKSKTFRIQMKWVQAVQITQYKSLQLLQKWQHLKCRYDHFVWNSCQVKCQPNDKAL